MANQVAGRHFSTWRATGQPAQPAIPGTTGAAVNSSTAGGVALGTLSGSNVWYMAGSEVSGTSASAMRWCDRLVHNGGLNGTLTTAQTVGGTIPARAGNGDSVQIWLECYTDLGATPSATVTCSYTNQAGTTGRT